MKESKYDNLYLTPHCIPCTSTRYRPLIHPHLTTHTLPRLKIKA